MPDTPPLDRAEIAKIVRDLKIAGVTDPERILIVGLKIGWNARGAADRGAIDASLASQMGGTAAGPYINNLERVLAALDWTDRS